MGQSSAPHRFWGEAREWWNTFWSGLGPAALEEILDPLEKGRDLNVCGEKKFTSCLPLYWHTMETPTPFPEVLLFNHIILLAHSFQANKQISSFL